MRKAFSLVEVLIAGFVLAAVMIPLVGLLTSSKTDQQSEDGMGEAVTLCENLMETVLSGKVPFQSIDAGGGSRLVRGGPDGDVNQAGFRDAADVDATALELEALISDGDAPYPGGGLARVKSYRGKTYFISFFAGKYVDHPGIPDPADPGHVRADIDQTLTFTYLERPDPIGLPYNLPNPRRDQLNRQVVLDAAQVDVGPRIEAIPYMRQAYAVNGADVVPIAPTTPYFYRDKVKNLPAGKQNHKLLAGWPQAPAVSYDLADTASDQRALWSRTLRDTVTRSNGRAPVMRYHPQVVDQRRFGLAGGGLMKVAMGVAFSPYAYSNLRKSDALREFWLVSFKAKLEAKD